MNINNRSKNKVIKFCHKIVENSPPNQNFVRMTRSFIKNVNNEHYLVMRSLVNIYSIIMLTNTTFLKQCVMVDIVIESLHVKIYNKECLFWIKIT